MRAIGSVLCIVGLAFFAALQLQGAVFAAVPEPSATGDLKANPDVTFGTLPNGLRYAIRRNTAQPGDVSMVLRIGAGSEQETRDQEGIAHLIEHMAFRGSAHVADGEIMQTLQRFGSQPGADTNAFTGPMQTRYEFRSKSDDQSVATVLGFLREIGSELTFSQSALDSERNVVLAEKRDRDTPDFETQVEQTSAEFPGHPFTRPTIGRAEVIEAAAPAQLRGFYDAYYRPERAVLVVVGDIDPAAVEAKIKALFSDWRGRGPDGHDDPGPYTPTGRSRTIITVVHPKISQTSLAMVWVPPYTAEDWSRQGRIDNFVKLIGEAALSRRIGNLAEAAGHPFIGGGVQSYDLPGVARGESLGAKNISDLPGTIGILTTAQRQLMAQGLTQADIDAVVGPALEAFKQAAAHPGFLATFDPAIAQGLADTVAFGKVDLSEQQQLELLEAAANGLTADRVNHVLRAQFVGEGPIIFLVSGATPLADKAGLEKMLASAESAPLATYEAPKVLPWTHTTFGPPGKLAERREVPDLGVTMARFENGVRLTIKPLQAPAGQVQVIVRFGHGRLDQRRDRLDSSEWSTTLLAMGGLSDMTWSDVYRSLAGRQVPVVAATEDTAFTLGTGTEERPGMTSTADLDLELQLLAATVSSPGWRADGWKSQVATTIQNDAASEADPDLVFNHHMRALLHPGDARMAWDTPQQVESFTPAAARAFIEPILKNGELEVLVVGDVTPDAAIAAVAKTLGALPKRTGTVEPAGARADPFPAPAAQPVDLHHSGLADQGLAEISWPTTDEHAAWADIAPTVILADILRQRVTDRLRTAEGLTYTPRGGAEFSRVFPGWGRISLLVTCKPQEIPKIYAEVEAIAADLADNPVSADELQRAVQPEIQSAARSQRQSGYWVMQLAGAQTNPDRLEYIRQTLPQLSAVTAADVQRVAKRWLKADRAFRIEVTPATGAPAASVASR